MRLIPLFQSLFWWISLLGSSNPTCSLASTSCFNPCFGTDGSRNVRDALKFQSLFWWISLLGWNRPWQASVR